MESRRITAGGMVIRIIDPKPRTNRLELEEADTRWSAGFDPQPGSSYRPILQILCSTTSVINLGIVTLLVFLHPDSRGEQKSNVG